MLIVCYLVTINTHTHSSERISADLEEQQTHSRESERHEVRSLLKLFYMNYNVFVRAVLSHERHMGDKAVY